MTRLLLVVMTVLGACAGASSETGQLMPDPLEDVDAEQLYRHGIGMAERGDLLRAEQYIVAAIERGYSEEEALPRLVEICVSAQRYAEALRHAQGFLESHPEQWSLRYVVATLHLGLGRVQRARNELEHVIRDAPEAPVPHYTLGTLHRDYLDDDEEAKRHFARYLELAPTGDHASEVRSWMIDPEPPPITRLPDHDELPEQEPAPAPSSADQSDGGPEPSQGDVS